MRGRLTRELQTWRSKGDKHGLFSQAHFAQMSASRRRERNFRAKLSESCETSQTKSTKTLRRSATRVTKSDKNQRICTIWNSSAESPESPETVSSTAARNHPTTHAGDQDDVSSQKTPSNYRPSPGLWCVCQNHNIQNNQKNPNIIQNNQKNPTIYGGLQPP